MTAWYNEIDPRAANTLEELIAAGEIAPGVVDRRSIVDVRVEDLRGFDQHHFFAGIGVWSHALRRAGWPDDRPCWTGSCPCQPFSLAGQGGGFDDPRHLWPHWFRLISEYRPHRCFGEQVASADVWLDLVHADMESLGFAFGAPDLAAAGFAGAHVRQRFMWVADAHDAEWWSDHAPRHLSDWSPTGRLESDGDAAERGGAGRVAHATSERRGQEHAVGGGGGGGGDCPQGVSPGLDSGGPDDRVGYYYYSGLAFRPGPVDERGAIRFEGPALGAPGPLRGCDWLLCHDAKIRPVEPGTFPLVAEAPARVGRLHGLGNAIDAEALTQFISAYIAAVEDRP